MTNEHPPPAPGTPAQPGPGQEDRLLAAAAYLGYLTGFWLVVPIVIYVLRRDRSRFVAHHAMRAIVLHVAAVPLFMLSWVLGTAVTVGLPLALSDGGHGANRAVGYVALFLGLAVWVAPWGLYLVACFVAAIRGFQGRMETGSAFGRLVERLLARDATVPGA